MDTEATQAIDPVEQVPQKEQPHKANRKKSRRTLIVALAAVVAVALCAGGSAWWSHDRTADAQTDCTQAVKDTSKASRAYWTLTDGDAKAAATIRPGDLKDTKTLATLQKAMKARTPRSVSCPTPISWFDRSGLQEAKTRLDSADAWYVRHTRTLKDDVKAVDDSRDAKTLADGQALYDSSDGQVADENTRTSLQDALKRKDADAVRSAMDAVNKSRDAKAQADRQAQADADAQADAAAQQQAVQSTTPSYTGNSGYTSGGGTGGYGSGYAGGGYSTPSHQAPAPAPAATPAPAAPAPSAPAPSGGSGIDWNAWVANQKPLTDANGNDTHGCNPDGSCGIG